MHMSVDFGREIVFRGDGADTRLLARFRETGASAAVFSTPGREQEEACRKLGIEPLAAAGIQFLSWQDAGRAKPGTPVVLAEGSWPGIARSGARGRDDEVSSASRQPWLDSDSFWVGCLRAVAPARPAVLGYLPDEKAGLSKDRVVPFDSLELALADAWVAGGNVLLAPEPRFKDALARGDSQATAAWSKLVRTAGWLKENIAWFRQPTVPIISALVEAGTDSAELVNLMYRQAASPALASAADPPPPAPGKTLALVAASINAPRAPVRDRILEHARQGATVVVDAPAEKAWWRVPGMAAAKEEDDRVFYKIGKGLVVAYRKPIEDPSEFALDVIDLVTHKKRTVRLFAAPSVIATVTQAKTGETLLLLVNYGSPQRMELTAHVQGLFTRARVERPEAPSITLKPMRRGSATELRVPEIGRTAVVILS
jgi:hypothetical protein